TPRAARSTLHAQLPTPNTMSFLSDIRRAFRGLYKARGFAGAVVLTLALGIGANTAMFTLLRGTLLRPLPNRQGERLVYLRQSAKGAGQDNVGFSVPEIIDYRSATKTLASIAEYSSMTFTMIEKDEPVHIQAGVVQRAPHYPTRTDLFVNMVTSPHHLSATMKQGRTHRMTEVFARLAPNATVEQSRAEIARIGTNVRADHPEAYERAAQYTIS